MLASVIPARLAPRRVAGGLALILLAGCSGDDLLLPDDGALAELRMVSGDQQSAPVGDMVEHPLVVEALDRLGRPLPGAIVVFEFVDSPSGAEIAPANTETDATGRVAVEVKLGTPVGNQTVEARPDDPESDLSVQFQLTAVEQGDGGDGDGGGGGGGEGGDGGDGGGGGGFGGGDDDHDDDDGGNDGD